MISIDEQVTYWTNGAERDYDTMQVLLASKRYPESLFFGHIVLEYAEENSRKIVEIYKNLCQKMTQKK